MWSSEIEHILRFNKNFIGCYPHDELPKIKSRCDCSIIINTAPSGANGEHWVAVRMTKNYCFYFDSFGVPIVNENIQRFVKKYKKAIYSYKCIQDVRSEKCGQFCIAFINNVDSIKNYKKFLNMFDTKLYLNDFIVHDLIK